MTTKVSGLSGQKRVFSYNHYIFDCLVRVQPENAVFDPTDPTVAKKKDFVVRSANTFNSGSLQKIADSV